MYIGEAFPTTMLMIQNACNLRFKDAYTTCYISHAKCNKCTKERYTYATNELQHQLRKTTTHKAHKRSAPQGETKGLDTTGKRAKKQKTHKLPVNT
jgi:hypothetical protein